MAQEKISVAITDLETKDLLRAAVADITDLRTKYTALLADVAAIRSKYNATLVKMDADFGDVTNASVDYAATNPAPAATATAVATQQLSE